nr:MAG TPA: hypothetical protein [Caudoviricetes sp.]
MTKIIKIGRTGICFSIKKLGKNKIVTPYISIAVINGIDICVDVCIGALFWQVCLRFICLKNFDK